MRRLLRLLLAVTAMLGLAAAAAPVQASTSVAGYDFSWPQCPVGVGNGQGQPLPSGFHAFMVVGLTNGTGLHENPCLARQWTFARAHAGYVAGYTMATYPTRAQRHDAATGHYGRCSTLTCRLRNNGWAQAMYADRSLRRVGAHPHLVWVDVEPRSQQPWSSSRARNSLVVKAIVAGLRARGYAVGIYSNRALWSDIAGYRTTLPEWVPAASTTRGCHLAFSHGPVYLSQWGHYYPRRHAGYDENGRCAAAPPLRSFFEHVG